MDSARELGFFFPYENRYEPLRGNLFLSYSSGSSAAASLELWWRLLCASFGGVVGLLEVLWLSSPHKWFLTVHGCDSLTTHGVVVTPSQDTGRCGGSHLLCRRLSYFMLSGTVLWEDRSKNRFKTRGQGLRLSILNFRD